MVSTKNNSVDDELITVIQVFRHGSRNPLRVFKNKLYEEEEERPEEMGQLTKKGKLECYQLGQYTKDRYKRLLAPNYSEKNAKIYSTIAERNMMSAQLFAAGLFPPTEQDLWNDTIQWHPVPIYLTGPAMLVGSPTHHANGAYRGKVQEVFIEHYRKNVKKDVLDLIIKGVGEELTTLEDLVHVCDHCLIATALGVALPDWIKELYPHPLCDFYKDCIRCWIQTNEMKKIYIGPLLHEIITHMETKIKDSNLGPKLLVFCAHDANITAVLDSLDINFVTWPKCAASLFFELRKKSDEYFVNIYYKATAEEDEAIPMNLRGCNLDCEFQQFKEAVMKFAFSEKDAVKESILLKDD